MPLKACRKRTGAVFCSRVRRERDRWHAPAALVGKRTDFVNQRVAVLIGHPDIADEHVGSPMMQAVQRLRCRANRRDVRSGFEQHSGQHFTRGRVVLDDEHLHAVESAKLQSRVAVRVTPPDALCLNLLFDMFASQRQFDDERGAAAVAVARGANGPAVQCHNLMHDREAEPQPAVSPRAGPLLERLEDVRQQLGADPRPIVPNRDPRRPVRLLEAQFDHAAHKVNFEYQAAGKATDNFAVPPAVQDGLSAVYVLRVVPFKALASVRVGPW